MHYPNLMFHGVDASGLFEALRELIHVKNAYHCAEAKGNNRLPHNLPQSLYKFSWEGICTESSRFS
jgi:hypothetical protein